MKYRTRRYFTEIGQDGVGELTYSRRSSTKIIADHTGGDDSLRGTGVIAPIEPASIDWCRIDPPFA